MKDTAIRRRITYILVSACTMNPITGPAGPRRVEKRIDPGETPRAGPAK